jgi:ABC-type multidrug transport system permease subunit
LNLDALKNIENTSVNISNDLTNQTINISGNNSNRLFLLIDNLEQQLAELTSLVNSTGNEIHLIRSTVDNMTTTLDSIKTGLDEEILLDQEYIDKIDASIVKIDEISRELDTKLAQLSRIQPGLAEKLIKPILSDYTALLKNVTNIQTSFPQLLVIIIMFLALLFSNIATLMEIHNKAYLRNLIAPVNDIIYVIGLLLTTVMIVFFQIVVLFIVAQTRLGIMIVPALGSICLITLLMIFIFVLLGMLFAYLFNKVQSSILITTFSALLFFLFSNTLAPIEAMAGFARFLSSYNPLVIGEYLIKEVQLMQTPLGILLPKILLLVIYNLILFFIVVMLAKENNLKRV